MSRDIRRTKGFTLVEILLATVIGALVVVVSIATFRSVTYSRESVGHYSEALARGRYAMNEIRGDLANFYRHSDPAKMYFLGSKGNDAKSLGDRLILYVVSDRKVRRDEAESDIYEVEYGLQASAEKGVFLTRRCAPVDVRQRVRGKGVLTRMARGMESFGLEYYDGQEWVGQWQERSGWPRLVRVTLGVRSEQGDFPAVVLKQTISLEPLPKAGGTK